MSKFTPSTGGKTARCSLSILSLLAILAITFSSIAQAQFHQVGTGAICTEVARTCVNNDSCSDDNVCTADTCDDSIPRVARCAFFFQNQDPYGDSMTVLEMYAEVQDTGGPTRIPAVSGDADIDQIFGTTTCVPGPFVECNLSAPGIGSGGGVAFAVEFELQASDLILGDLDIIPYLKYKDNCDAPGTPGCSDEEVFAGFPAATTLIEEGCSNGDPITCEDDGNECTSTPVCHAIDGCDVPYPPTNVGGSCTDVNGDACDESFCSAEGICEDGFNTVVCPFGGDECNTADACDPDDGECKGSVPTPDIVCEDVNGDACDESFCSAEGICEDGFNTVVCPNGGDECNTADACDPDDGECKGSVPDNIGGSCTDTDGDLVCTEALCDETGTCTQNNEPDPLPLVCSATEICRTPGFWATRGGAEKKNSTNITQAVIGGTSGGYLSVCGAQIATTNPDVMWSTTNAMCTSVKGVSERQLVRQLTALALNCVMSGGDGDCSGTSVQGLANECNALCGGDPVDVRTVNDCISEIDCFNNGGAWDGDHCIAWMGSCEISGLPCDSEDTINCELGEDCTIAESCHDLTLCQEGGDLCFDPPGPAGGTNDCKIAKKNGVYLPY